MLCHIAQTKKNKACSTVVKNLVHSEYSIEMFCVLYILYELLRLGIIS